MIEERARLEVTPHDDWRRIFGGFIMPDMLGGPIGFSFNPDNVSNQVMDFMVRRYRAQGLDQLNIMSHMNRYMVMNEFFHVNTERLTADEMIVEKPEYQDGQVGLSHSLVEVLAAAPYEATMMNTSGHEVRTFDYDKVVEAARDKMAAKDDDVP